MRDLGLIPAWEGPLEKGNATHPGILAQRIPWTVQSSSRKESDTTEQPSLSIYILAHPELPLHFKCKESVLHASFINSNAAFVRRERQVIKNKVRTGIL